MLILTTSNLTARLKTKIPVSGGQKISHEIEAMCATQPASPRWRPNHEILWHRKIAGHKPAGMTRLVCVLLSSNANFMDSDNISISIWPFSCRFACQRIFPFYSRMALFIMGISVH